MEEAAKTLVTIGQLVGEEFRKLRGVGGEVARLRNELATINALLRMQSEADEGGLDHFLREWMKQLREVGYDAEDCVHLYLFRVRSRDGDRWFVRWKRHLTTCWSRHCLAGDISDLRALASAINEQHARYGFSLEPLRRRDAALSLGPAAASARPQLGPADNHYSRRPQFIGSKNLAMELAKKLKASGASDEPQPPKVLSIWGFGGLGKTTLALEVCRLLEAEFQCQAQVSVCQTFSGKDLQGLLKRLLRQISDANQQKDLLANIDKMDVVKLEEKLKENLQNKRYLILIDDVWSIPAWDMIWSKMPRSKHGSIIIVTTRMDHVAKACSDYNNDYIHHMEKLDSNDSEQLFISKAFGSDGNPCPNDQDLKDTMNNILKKCGGLPLAIVSIASLLASYKLPEGKAMWGTVQKSIGAQLETNPTFEGMRQILTLSYNDLPHHLKACMMYFSIFPEDYMIRKDRLLKRWIAEGLVAEKRVLTQMELAEGYLNELMSRSMIDRATDVCAMYERMEERCRVHDMMLEIMVPISLEANFVSLVGGQYEGMTYTDTIRRLSIHGGVEAHNDSDSSSSKSMAVRHGMGNGIIINGAMVQHVRSLSIFDPEACKLLDRLGEFTLLRVLDLEDCKGLEEKHMGYICRMYLLRFLSLRGTDIKVLPPRVDNLEHLRMLDVRQTHLKDLPKTVTKLEKLEHLLFSTKGSWSGWKLPRGINKIKALRQVNRADVIHDPKVAEEIGELDQLQELAIYVNSRDPKMNPEVYEKLACFLSKTFSLRWLDVGDLSCNKWPFQMTMDFLHKVESPPRLLQYLKINGYIDRMPDWVRSLNNLVELDIAWTYIGGAQLVDFLCKLPKLKRLSLGAYFMMEGEMVVGSNQPFPELKELNLFYAFGGIPSGYRFEEGSMPKLEKLVVEFFDQWKTLVGVEHMTNLKEVQYIGHRGQLKNAVEKLEEINKNRDAFEKIAARVTYWD